MGTRAIDVRSDISATLTYAGSDNGNSQNDQRTITACHVQNDSDVDVALDVSNGAESFTDVIAAGQNKVVSIVALVQRWQVGHTGGFWKDIDIRWRVPA
jgi:hypothetical protein